MLKDVISATYKGEYQIEVTFEDGAMGMVDFLNICQKAVYSESLKI